MGAGRGCGLVAGSYWDTRRWGVSGDREEQAGNWRGEQGGDLRSLWRRARRVARRVQTTSTKSLAFREECAPPQRVSAEVGVGSRDGGGGGAGRAPEEKAGRPGEPGGSRSGTHRISREAKCSEAQRLPPECEYQALAPLTSPQSARVRKQTRTSKLQVRKLRLEAAEQGAKGQGPAPSRLLS